MFEYLKSRGLGIDIIKKFGLKEKEKYVMIPYFNQRGKFLFNKCRSKYSKKFWYYPKGKNIAIYNFWNLASYKDYVVITEGEIDCLTLLQFGINAVGCPGAGLFNKNWVKLFSHVEKIYIAYDNDIAGIEGARKLAEDCFSDRDTYNVLVPRDKEAKDINDLVVELEYRKDDFKKLIDRAVRYEATTIETMDKVKNIKKHSLKCDKTKNQIEDIEDFLDIHKGKEIYPWAKFNVRFYSNRVLERYCIAYDKHDRLWIYNRDEGIWLDGAEKDITEVLRNNILEEKHLTTKNVNEVINDIKGRTFDRYSYEEPDKDLIPFANKIYNLKNNKFLSYNPNYFFINKFPVDVDKKGKCPTIDKIFADLVGDDRKEILYELAAYCLYRGYPYQKIFLLVGDGSNGKSTYKTILSRFLGYRNICSVSLGGLVFSQFGTSQLYKKYLNLCGELDDITIRNTAILKQITGNDLINGEKKYKDPFSFVNYAKVIITTNRIPETLDKSTAFYRRIYIIDFPNKFEAGKNAIEAIEDSIPEEEYSGLAYKCVNKLRELKERGFVFSINESIEEIRRKYEDLSSPLSKFLKENTIKNISGKVLAKKFNRLFFYYLEKHRIIRWSHVRINKYMKQKGYLLKTKGVKSKDRAWTTKKFWIGLKWKN